jgi:hypothetical protein
MEKLNIQSVILPSHRVLMVLLFKKKHYLCYLIDKFLCAGIEEVVRQVQAVGGKAVGYVCDLSKKESIYECAEKVKREVGKVRSNLQSSQFFKTEKIN